jgi:hypothetical protein
LERRAPSLLDALITTSAELIGVESKRYEPFRDKKRVDLPDAYDRPVWGDAMGAFERLRDGLRTGAMKYQHLDAAQLVKHGFGLTTQAKKAGLRPILVYLFAEPAQLAGRPLPRELMSAHRQEIADFAHRVAGADVAFHTVSYREWIETRTGPDAVLDHAHRLLQRFAP